MNKRLKKKKKEEENCYCHIIQQEEVNEIMNIKCVRMRDFFVHVKDLLDQKQSTLLMDIRQNKKKIQNLWNKELI